jgi:hypothetical protein
MITCGIVWKLQLKIIDVEMAFLHGDLEEDIYIWIAHKGWTILLTNAFFFKEQSMGLCKAPGSFSRSLWKGLKSIGFKPSITDLCLMTQHCDKGLIIMTRYVDDWNAVGHKK